jgi:hypothetical protein
MNSSGASGDLQIAKSIPATRRAWPDYRAVWRWHFYAGLFCIPFVCFLAITGAIYLFKPQVERWQDRPYDQLQTAQTAAPSRAVQAALAANPGWTLHAYEIPQTAQSAARVIIGRAGAERRVYVDRGSLAILKTRSEDTRLMRIIFRLHGQLLLGDRGSMMVELAASWAIVMIITGLYLWWPRQVIGLAGVVYPRIKAGRRLFWRDMHAVTGAWVSLFALLMLFSGLPWSKNWGGYLKEVRKLTGTASAHQDWTTGRSSEIAEHKAMDAAGMAAMPGMTAHAGPAGRGGRKDIVLSSEALARPCLAAVLRRRTMERQVRLPEPTAAGRPQTRSPDRRRGQPDGLRPTQPHRPDIRGRHRHSRRPAVRLGQSGAGPVHRRQPTDRQRQRRGALVAAARDRRAGRACSAGPAALLGGPAGHRDHAGRSAPAVRSVPGAGRPARAPDPAPVARHPRLARAALGLSGAAPA